MPPVRGSARGEGYRRAVAGKGGFDLPRSLSALRRPLPKARAALVSLASGSFMSGTEMNA